MLPFLVDLEGRGGFDHLRLDESAGSTRVPRNLVVYRFAHNEFQDALSVEAGTVGCFGSVNELAIELVLT